MYKLKIFYLLTLFTSTQFSNARTRRLRITNPDDVFAYTASLHSLFVREPGQSAFTQHLSSMQMFLGLHVDNFTLSFWESGAPYTLLTFRQRNVDFELLYAQTMIFSVTENYDTRHFRCIFSADENTFNTIFSYLSLCTGSGPLVYRMQINVVKSYMKMDYMADPILLTVEGLHPAKLYDQETKDGYEVSSNKVFSITQSTAEDEEAVITRLLFRTGNFEGCQLHDKVVVLKFVACSDWLYVFHFGNKPQAKRFMKYLAPFEQLDLPADVESFILSASMDALTSAQNESKPNSQESQPEEHHDQPQASSSVNSSRKQPLPDAGVSVHERPRQRRPRTVFTKEQLERLQDEFDYDHYPSRQHRRNLADDLGLNETQVKNWFQNQRDRGS